MPAPLILWGQKTGGGRTPSPSGLRWLPCVIAAFAAELAVIYLVRSSQVGRDWMPVLLIAAHLLLLPFLLRNLTFWGIRLILMGLGLNLIVMTANGGYMPVAPQAVQAIGKHNLHELQLGDPIPRSKNVLLGPNDTNARWLSDVIVLPIPKPYKRAVSVGDLFVVGGVLVTFFEVARRYSRATGPMKELEFGTDLKRGRAHLIR